jgi:L-ascorbate metabolism protein UlaG (beta-lactamase superfamily)
MPQVNVLVCSGAPPPGSLDSASIFFVGNATTVIRCGAFTILTDPNFLHAGDHAHLGYGLTTRRLTNPAIEPDALPPLDLCVLSHLHGAHWDRIARDRLPKDLPIVTTPHASKALRKQRFRRTIALETWDVLAARKGDARLRLTAVPGRHGPRGAAALFAPTMGSVLEFGRAGEAPRVRVWISGDTLAIPELAEIPRRFPSLDLALVHLGGTRMLGVLLTMDGEQGARALRLVRPKRAIPIHFDDYTAFRSPLADFHRAAALAKMDTDVVYLERGDTYQFRLPASRPVPVSTMDRRRAAR